MYKLSNWNLERPKENTLKTRLATEKIIEENSDLIVLTETSKAVDLSKHYPYKIRTKSYERTPDEHWVTIWSKWEITENIPTHDEFRTICGKIKSPFGEIIVFGTIIPYHMAGVSGVRYGNLNYKAWEYHEKDLIEQSEIWKSIINKYPNFPLFVIGDFNQTRFKNIGYGTKKVRNLLTEILEDLNMSCLTEMDFSEYLKIDPRKGKVRKNIDHICVSKSFLENLNEYKIGGWDHFNDEGKYMSDHNGVFLQFDSKTNAT